jgi:excisionase family DNA binding protein
MNKRRLGVGELTLDAKVLVSMEEAAGLLSVGRTVVYALVRSNQLRSVKVGRTRRVVVASLYTYVEQLLSQAS